MKQERCDDSASMYVGSSPCRTRESAFWCHSVPSDKRAELRGCNGIVEILDMVSR